MQGYILNIPIFSYNCFVDLNLEIHQLIDKEKIRESFREIIISIGENPDRDGLLDTPKRLAVLYEELFSGLKLNPDDVLSQSFQEPRGPVFSDWSRLYLFLHPPSVDFPSEVSKTATA